MKESTQNLVQFTRKYPKTPNLTGFPISIASFLTLVDTLCNTFLNNFNAVVARATGSRCLSICSTWIVGLREGRFPCSRIRSAVTGCVPMIINRWIPPVSVNRFENYAFLDMLKNQLIYRWVLSGIAERMANRPFLWWKDSKSMWNNTNTLHRVVFLSTFRNSTENSPVKPSILQI